MYKIRICISKDKYTNKPNGNDIKKMRFECKELSIEEFATAIREGYSFCALMQDNWRNKNNFVCAKMLVYDIDHSKIPMQDYISNLQFHPTICYTSPSNCGGDYSFRLIFCLDKEICSLEEYYTTSMSLMKQLGMNDVDERSHFGEQYWNGNSNSDMCIYHEILSHVSISLNHEYIRNVSDNKSTGRISNWTVKRNTGIQDILCLNDQFIQDYFKMNYRDFIGKYTGNYPNIQKTPIELNEDEPIVYYPPDYYEIRRPWKRINGEIQKIRDGEGRRRKLFINALIRRKIKPDITFENLLFNLVWEYEYFYLAGGNPITKKILYDIAANAMKCEIADFNKGKPRNKFFVNPLYCEKYGLTPKQVIGKLRNKKQYIGDFYDVSMTDKQNQQVMKEYGLDVSLKTIQRWRIENNIGKYNKIS